ncbi:unnamed protein product [Rangifer tarandus platyrhynchus]|uniref:Uncharacterized protein n=3 Tax=Rangifer tarandus platyrhynchus TaxID=3082113 RepID=A0AC60AAQ1_RANTA|nr:unnamed protein product [Rangifer tarandus platyrhynchus]CAI9714382.1 unnamed protein product [Rangifer tarandus platyrhynchus]
MASSAAPLIFRLAGDPKTPGPALGHLQGEVRPAAHGEGAATANTCRPGPARDALAHGRPGSPASRCALGAELDEACGGSSSREGGAEALVWVRLCAGPGSAPETCRAAPSSRGCRCRSHAD